MKTEYTMACLFGGIGGGALGFNGARAEYMGKVAKFRTICSIDSDPVVCRNYESITGGKAVQMDLFDRQQYTDFHDKEPSEDWHEAEPWDIWKAFGEQVPDVIFTSPPCLPAEGMVLTPDGEKKIESIHAGDKVLTHKGRYKKVLKVGTHIYEGKMYGFRLNGTVETQCFTAEHPIWVRKVEKEKDRKPNRGLADAEFIKSENVCVGDRIGFPIDQEISGCARSFVESFGNPSIVTRGGSNIDNKYGKPEHETNMSKVVDLRSFGSDEDLWYLFGAYLGDGYRRKERHEIIYCAGASNGKKANEIRRCLSSIGLKWNEDESGGIGNIKIRLDSKHLWQLVGLFGDGAANKNIPVTLMNLEEEFIYALLQGYRDTDGSEQPRRMSVNELQARWKIASVSLPLLKSVQRLLLRLHTFGCINHCWPGGTQIIEGRVVQTLPRYELVVRRDPVKRCIYEFEKDAVWVRVKEIHTRDSRERVYNLEVDEDNTFCAPMMATHNCKGFSGLLPEKSASSKKYQALNLLTIRGIDITLEACREYGGELPALFLLENVPRIMTRGKKILERIKATLKKYGYKVNDETHDCGEIGGLGQHRKRYLLIARNENRMPAFVYKPEVKPLKTIGDVIGPLPLPGDEVNGGPLNRVPTLQRKTWERLAFIPAGGDWRDLEKVEFENYRLEHEPRSGAWAVEDWGETSGTVTGGAGVGRSNGVAAVADPRTGFKNGTHASIYRVSKYEETAPTVTGAMRPNNGSLCVGDPRLNGRESRHPGVYRVVRMDEPSPTVTGTRFGSGALAIADPRTPNDHYKGEYNRVDGYGVQEWDETAKTVRGAARIMNSASSVADPRLNSRKQRYPGIYRVEDWQEPSNTVLGQTDIQCGALSVPDPRLGCSPRSGSYGVQDWSATATTVTGSGDVHSGSTAVADPRIPKHNERCVMIIIAEDGTWHRPFTTFELAVGLQGFPLYLPDGRPFQLEGCSDAKAREYIGNAVPPDAARGMANTILMAMVMSEAGETFIFTHQDIWVSPNQNSENQMVH